MAISYRAAQTLIKRKDETALATALDGGLDANLANHNGWTLLMLAAVEGVPALGTLLLDHGARVNEANRNAETALSLAAQKAHLEFLQLLLERGASKDVRPHGAGLAESLAAAPSLEASQRAAVLEALGL